MKHGDTQIHAALFYGYSAREHAVVVLGFALRSQQSTIAAINARFLSQYRCITNEIPFADRQWDYTYNASTAATAPLLFTCKFDDLRDRGMPLVSVRPIFRALIGAQKTDKVRWREMLESRDLDDRFRVYALLHTASRFSELEACVRPLVKRWIEKMFQRNAHIIEHDFAFLNLEEFQRVRWDDESLSEDTRHFLAHRFYASQSEADTRPRPRIMWRCHWQDAPEVVSHRVAAMQHGYVYMLTQDAHTVFANVVWSRLMKRCREIDRRFELGQEAPRCHWFPGCTDKGLYVRRLLYDDISMQNDDDKEDEVPVVTVDDVLGLVGDEQAIHETMNAQDRGAFLMADAYAFWKRTKDKRHRQTVKDRAERAQSTDPLVEQAVLVYRRALAEQHPPHVAFMRAFGNTMPPCVSAPLVDAIRRHGHLKYSQRTFVFPFLAHARIPLKVVEDMWHDLCQRSTHAKGKHQSLNALPRQFYERTQPKVGQTGYRYCETVIKNHATPLPCCPFSEHAPGVEDIEDMVEARQLQCMAVTEFPPTWTLRPLSLFRRQLRIAYESS